MSATGEVFGLYPFQQHSTVREEGMITKMMFFRAWSSQKQSWERETYRDKPECEVTIWSPCATPSMTGVIGVLCMFPLRQAWAVKDPHTTPKRERKGPHRAVLAVCPPHPRGRKIRPDTQRSVVVSTGGCGVCKCAKPHAEALSVHCKTLCHT